MHRRALYAEENESDQRYASDAVRLEAVGARPDGIARIVAGAIGNHAGIASVVFFDLEDDFHQVGTDIGNLGEDAAGDSQRRCAERFADREPDEALTGIIAGHEK